MDPLSIAVSAVSVAGAAAKISIWLYDVVETTRAVDTTVHSLHREVKALDDNLKSLSQTLRGCQSQALTLMHMNDDIWRSIENNLNDCGEALDELQKLVEEVTRPITSRNIFRKPNLAMRLGMRKREITEFQDKINKSNSAMQTAVGVVSLSLALRQNVSSEMLMSELQRLRGLVEKTQAAARDSSHVSYPAAARMSRSLQGLAHAARKFHSNASTTASTRYEGARRSRRQGSAWTGSDAGSLTDFDRDRIRDWTSGLGPIDEVTDTSSTVGTAPTLTTTTTDRETAVTTPDPEEDDDDDLELELEIFQNAEELGRLSFGKRDYDNAEKFLHKAVSGAIGTSSDPAHFENLKLQLSICYCFQAKWQAAEAVLFTLGKKRRKADLPVFHLLHAIALAHLIDENYDSAYIVCKKSLQGKKKAHGGKTNQDYIDSLCLLATICEVRGELIEAAAILHSVPDDKMTKVFPTPEQFIRSHKSIIDNAFGKGFNTFDEVEPSSGGHAAEEADDDASERGEEADRSDRDTGEEFTTDNEERISSRVGGWDTGKEILTVPEGSHMTINPITNKRIFSDVETYDHETGRILAWAEWDSCEWIPLHRYFEAHHYMIDDLIIDAQARRNHNLPSICMNDQDKHSDLLVVDIEQLHDAAYGTDSHKELYIPDVEEYPVRPIGPGPGLGISTWQPPTISTTLADDFSSNLYVSEPRGDGVTSAPPLHTHNSMDSTLLSPTTPPVYRQHQATRSVDFTGRPIEQSNNPFRRAASQRILNNPVTETLRPTASFENLRGTHAPPAPWTGRRYGTTTSSPRLLQTPAVFLRHNPVGPTDGLVLGIHLSPETIETAISFDTGAIETCPGTLYLNHASQPPHTLPWFECLSHPTPSSPPSSLSPLSLTSHPYPLIHLLQLHALQSQSSLNSIYSLPFPPPPTTHSAPSHLSSSLTRLAAGLAKWIDTVKGGFYLAFTPLDEIVFSVSDTLLSLPDFHQLLVTSLSSTPLFSHAKLSPSSLSIIWHHLLTHGREILLSHPGRSKIPVLVLQAGHLLTEVTPYEIVAESGAVVVRSAGDVCIRLIGTLQVEVRFAQLAYDKLAAVVGRYRMRIAKDKLMGLVRTCAVTFRREVLLDFGKPGFGAGGEQAKWTANGLEVPPGFPGLESGSLEFTFEELRGCFKELSGYVREVMAEGIGCGTWAEDGGSFTVFMAGSFSNSPLLANIVTDAVKQQQRGGGETPRLWTGEGCAALGAVHQGRQMDYVNLQTA